MFFGFIFPGDLTVSLIVFSGRPKPKWKILSTNPGYKEIVTMLQNATNAKLTYRPVDMPARLGYKGLLVQSTMKKESDLIVGPKDGDSPEASTEDHASWHHIKSQIAERF